LDVDTGFPTDLVREEFGPGVELWSVSIVSGSAMLGEMLTTAMFTMEINDFMNLLINMGAYAIWMLSNGSVHGSPGAGSGDHYDVPVILLR